MPTQFLLFPIPWKMAMVSRTLNKCLTALLLCLMLCPGLMGAEKREMIEVTEGTDGWFRIMLPKETPADTLLCGAFFARNEDARIFTLINVYNRLKEKKIIYESILRMEKESEEAIQEYKGTPSEAPMREMLKSSLERAYELYGHPSDYNTQEWSETRLMTIKASISKECGGGKLWAFSSFREPRHGLVAVARKDAAGNRKWGFMSMTGRMVVPCIYDDVLDFNNRRYWSNPGFDDRPDEDERPWTVVRKGDRIGMIDNSGKIMVPIIFGLYQDVERMVFHMTPKGELAAAKDPSTKKHGLIDRKGNWVIQPKYEELGWNGDDNCFCYYTGKYDHGSFMGYDKTVIDLSH